MNRKNPLLTAFAAAVIVAIFVLFIAQGLAYFSWNDGKPLTGLVAQGQYSRSILNLANPVFYVAAAVFFAVLGAVIYIGFKFHDKEDLETADEIPHQQHGKTWAEISWTVAPAVVLLVVGLATVVTLGELNSAAADDAVEVRVEGQQWWWKFSYDSNRNGTFGDDGDIVTANEMVIPAGTDIALSQTSNDVIHSFWIPALNGKKDAVPGMITDWKLKADEPGVYRGQCTEFCGLSHANMRMLVRSVSPQDFGTWQSNQLKAAKKPAAGSKEAAGEAIFKGQLCSSCHLIRGVSDAEVSDPESGVKRQLVSGVAPDLTHFATRGTFSGSIFNSRYPDPEGKTNVPFGQTCKVTGLAGTSSLGLGGGTLDPAALQALPPCPEPNQTDAKDIPWAAGTGNPDNPPNNVVLAAWLRNPPALKPMVPEPDANPVADGRRRGMPNLQLTEEQIDQLVAYLNSLS